MVTSNERTSSSNASAIGLLFSAAVMCFVLMFGGTASGQEIDDQESTTTNAGAGAANTGVNGAAGNGSNNTATGDQTATATGAGDESVAPNSGGANNTSGGTASVTTGDANATGNSATNNTQQTVVSGHNGAVVLVDQEASVTNIGVGVSNTGFNAALGNVSQNVSTADQQATATGGDEGVASNTANVGNNSGGDARVTTGDATSTGSVSTNNVNQTYDGNYSGLGVVVIVDQNVDVTNFGLGISNTGLNAAVGNDSQNNATVGTANNPQTATADGSVAVNNATASTNSDGSARVMTGDANAVGNLATNNVSQIANVTATGTLGSIVLIDQNASALNAGISLANTGLNLAVGNTSASTSNAVQGAVSGAGPPDADSVASNDGIASTSSNGTGEITTGNADALGNRSNTNLTQVVDVNTGGNGIVLTDQTAQVTNFGIGIANTGGNWAIGNDAQSNATVDQDADSQTALGDDAVAANFGTASTNSNGSASVNSGNANGTGNIATTNVNQTVNVDTLGGVFLPDQTAVVGNFGIGIANTGLNTAVGNASPVNAATTTQEADVLDATESAVASNFGEASTNSDGDASIWSGNANATGNDSGATTNIAQTVDANGSDVILSDQTAVSTDFGIGISNTGLNLAIGNASLNNAATTTQTATADDAGDDAVASNFGSSLSNSDGSASITTGNAIAVGSSSHTNIAQTVDANDGGLLISDQEVTGVNIGIGLANTGLNAAIGNASNANNSQVNQTATTDASEDGDNVAANFGTSSTTSNGSATIDTGDALGIGSRTTLNVAQTVDFSGDNFALVDQTTTAVSFGIGFSNTGLNFAIGNASNANTALTDQTADIAGGGLFDDIGGDIVASNDGQAIVNSDGTADITTGNANSIGNDSDHTLNIAQSADINGGGFALIDQTVESTNVGIGISNTGLNLAIGNASLQNQAQTFQAATVTENGLGGIDADDVVASNSAVSSSSSNGSASIDTGAANSIGNTGTTTVAQTADFNSDGSGFALVDQSATQLNFGIGISNTGLNGAVGNASANNAALVDQTAAVEENGIGSIEADDVVAANTASTNVNSDGDATIRTGAASAIGNASRTTFIQTTDVNTDSGFALVDQVATETNIGIGIANTGGNLAIGNTSTNTAGANQTATVSESCVGGFLLCVLGEFFLGGGGDIEADDIAAVNTATVNVNSDGDATIETGAANATGNISSTTIAQTADANFTGNGFLLNDQDAAVTNFGIGFANSGINLAVGNASTNTIAPAAQTATVSEDGIGSLEAEDIAAVNTATSTVNSNGSARIATGNAFAIGNDSGATTTIAQTANANIGGTGFVLNDQTATVFNVGIGIGNSGVNLAIGNTSTTTTGPATQDAAVTEAGFGDLEADDVAAVNTANNNVVSNGTAEIRTGVAEGVGNRSTTNISQVSDSDIDGSGFVIADQIGLVANVGIGVGNSGINLAIGNASTNTSCTVNTPCTQTAGVTEASFGDLDIEDGAAVNTLNNVHNSDGSASITTGDSFATGNESTTTKTQVIDADIAGTGFVLADQVDPVINLGIAVANSGLNLGIGNISQNNAAFTQEADISEAGGGDLTAEDVVATNTATTSNISDGSVDITTGCADAHGNVSTTDVNQVLNANIVGGGFVLSDQEADVTNIGLALANTGLNFGIGNGSTNTVTSTQDADITPVAALVDDGVAANTVIENNTSTGHVDIDTGDAYALGNHSATGIAQAASYPGDGLFLPDQTDSTTNLGLALANSGVNLAAGNTSVNTSTNVAAASAPGGVAANTAELNNLSDGSADVATGDATAVGNAAANSSCQGINAPINCPVPSLPPVPPCPCHRPTSQPPVPPVPPTPPTDTPPGVPGGPSTPPGAVLARTGVDVGVQAMLGLLLLAIGALLRRRARTA